MTSLELVNTEFFGQMLSFKRLDLFENVVRGFPELRLKTTVPSF